MPTSVVHTDRDEAKWSKAKAQAAKQDKGDNYAYIMSIYKNMGSSHDFKSAAFVAGHDRTMKLSGIFDKEPETKPSDVMMGAGGAALAGGATAGGLAKALDVVPEEALERGRVFRTLSKGEPDDAAFMARYSDLGSQMIGGPALNLPGREPTTGRSFIKSVRTNPLVEAALVSPGRMAPWDDPSVRGGAKRHYTAFQAGPESAVREMFRESFDDVPKQFRAELLGARQQAAKSLFDKGIAPTPELMTEALEQGPKPRVGKFFGGLEQQIAEADPQAYQQMFESMQVPGSTRAAMPQHDALLKQLFGNVDPRQADLDRAFAGAGGDAGLQAMSEAQRQQHMRKAFTAGDDVMSQYALEKMVPRFRRYAGAYENIIDPMLAGDALRRKVLKGSRPVAALGALGLAGGALASQFGGD